MSYEFSIAKCHQLHYISKRVRDEVQSTKGRKIDLAGVSITLKGCYYSIPPIKKTY